MVLPACAATANPVELPIPSRGAGVVCRSQGLARFVGRQANSEVASEMRKVSGAKTVRWVRPGSVITMEYRDDRVTVRVSASDRVIAAHCG
jgi:hypothetical protein